MNKPESLSMWIIARNTDTGIKIIWYGSYDELIEEENESHWVEIPFDNWLAEDLAEVFGNELEDANHHSWTWMPSELLRVLKSNNVQDKECFNIILEMYNRYSYN